jgi:hypothetical protein
MKKEQPDEEIEIILVANVYERKCEKLFGK